MSEIDPGARIGAVTLRVADLEGARHFYARTLGLVERQLVAAWSKRIGTY